MKHNNERIQCWMSPQKSNAIQSHCRHLQSTDILPSSPCLCAVCTPFSNRSFALTVFLPIFYKILFSAAGSWLRQAAATVPYPVGLLNVLPHNEMKINKFYPNLECVLFSKFSFICFCVLPYAHSTHHTHMQSISISSQHSTPMPVFCLSEYHFDPESKTEFCRFFCFWHFRMNTTPTIEWVRKAKKKRLCFIWPASM